MGDHQGSSGCSGTGFIRNCSLETLLDHDDKRSRPPCPYTVTLPFTSTVSPTVAEDLLRIELELCAQLSALKFSHPVEYVYSPINYAFNLHAQFVRKFANTTKKVLFLGMNPGPWGMSQTGVPFGEVSVVRDWLSISGPVSKPPREHPARLVLGLECLRSEVSGKRFWGLFQDLCGPNPYVFFQHCFIYNQCPIALMSASGKNITPAELKTSESKALLTICDAALTKVLLLLQVQTVIAIGKFAEKRAGIAVRQANLNSVQVVYIPHPSPRNARCHSNWQEIVVKVFENMAENNSSGSSAHTHQEMIPVVGDTINEEEGMEVAMKLARQALAVGEVPVGCVFVYESKIIAIGRNTVNETRNATRHAEINCIDDVLKWCKESNRESSSVFAATEVFVTVEPCIMCAGALHKLHLKQITYGCHNDRFGGCGTVLDTGLLAANPCKITAGVRAEEAMQLLKDFYKGTNPNAPVPNIKKKAGRKTENVSE